MTLESGRTLDALVAEKVMGWKSTGMLELNIFDEQPWLDENQCEQWRPPYYSTDIKAAWEVVEHFSARDGHHSPAITSAYLGEGKEKGFCVSLGGVYSIFAPTAPLAICLAALKAVGVEVDE